MEILNKDFMFGEVTYKEKKRKFVVTAITIRDDDTLTATISEMGNLLRSIKEGKCIPCALKKASHFPNPIFIYFGVSICNPKDEYNQELGKTIAEGKAICPRTRLLEISLSGLNAISGINISHLLSNIHWDIINNPESYILHEK